MNNKEFTEFLRGIDPDIDIELERNGYDLFIVPSGDSPLMDSDFVLNLPTPQHAQFMERYMGEFNCIFQYKGTKLGRLVGSDYGYWLEQHYANGVSYYMKVIEMSGYSNTMDFIVMMNDGVLPTDTSKSNPYRTVMALGVDDYQCLNPLLSPTFDKWTAEIKQEAKDEPEIFWDAEEGFKPSENDWERACRDSLYDAYRHYIDCRKSPTQEQIKSATSYLSLQGDTEENRATLEGLVITK